MTLIERTLRQKVRDGAHLFAVHRDALRFEMAYSPRDLWLGASWEMTGWTRRSDGVRMRTLAVHCCLLPLLVMDLTVRFRATRPMRAGWRLYALVSRPLGVHTEVEIGFDPRSYTLGVYWYYHPFRMDETRVGSLVDDRGVSHAMTMQPVDICVAVPFVTCWVLHALPLPERVRAAAAAQAEAWNAAREQLEGRA
jgi:hypothetical protein